LPLIAKATKRLSATIRSISAASSSISSIEGPPSKRRRIDHSDSLEETCALFKSGEEDSQIRQIERIRNPNADDFKKHLAAYHPVIITGAMDDWRAMASEGEVTNT
jgi:hypothetical protein